MITVSQEARAHIPRLLADARAPGGGLRIRAAKREEDESVTCELEVAGRPDADETVVETGGVRLFLDRDTADFLDVAELVMEDGELALALPEAAGCAPG